MRRKSLVPGRRNKGNGEPDKRSAAHACRNRKSVPTFRRKKERRAPWDGQAALRLSCPPLRRHSPCLLLAVSIAPKVRRLAKKLHLLRILFQRQRKAGATKQPRRRTGLSRSRFAFPFLHAYRNSHVQRFLLSHRLPASAPLCKAAVPDCARTRCTSDKADIDGGPANAGSRQTGTVALQIGRSSCRERVCQYV